MLSIWSFLFETVLKNVFKSNLYTQQSSFRCGASEAGEGVYTEYMTEADAARNKTENSSATCIINSNLMGKNVLITLLPFEKNWKIIFSPDDVYCYEFSEPCNIAENSKLKQADLHITATPKALFAMLLRGDRTGIKLEGDVVLAQTLEHCFHDFTSEDILSILEDAPTGNFSLYPIRFLLKTSRKKIQTLHKNAQTTLTDYLQEDTDCLPLSSEVRDFCDAVDELRLKMDRLEANFYREIK